MEEVGNQIEINEAWVGNIDSGADAGSPAENPTRTEYSYFFPPCSMIEGLIFESNLPAGRD